MLKVECDLRDVSEQWLLLSLHVLYIIIHSYSVYIILYSILLASESSHMILDCRDDTVQTTLATEKEGIHTCKVL